MSCVIWRGLAVLTRSRRSANFATTTSRPIAKKAGAPTADVPTMRVPYNTRFRMQMSMFLSFSSAEHLICEYG